MNKKLLILTLCAALALAGVAAGTVAFLTDRDVVTNVFSVGDVQIKLDEMKVNKDGVPVGEDGEPLEDQEAPVRVTGNDYHLVPGLTYTKDPTITVLKGNEACYVRMMVTITNYTQLQAIMDALHAQDAVTYPTASLLQLFEEWGTNWVQQGDPAVDTVNNTVTYEFRHNAVIAPQGEDTVLQPLFAAFTVPGDITGEQLATVSGMEIRVEGHAIQTASFQSADLAWGAFDAQEGAGNESNP